MKGIDSIAYVFSEVEPWNMKRLRAYDVSEVNDFTGTFSNTPELNTFYIKDWNVSNGLYFTNMFYNSSDNYSFKYLRDWDCSKGVSYNFMFYEPTDWNEIDYDAVSHMRVNPNASFLEIFKDIPREHIELFRNWFPDDELIRIYNRLTGKLLIEDDDKNLSEYEYFRRHFRKVPKNNRLTQHLGMDFENNY